MPTIHPIQNTLGFTQHWNIVLIITWKLYYSQRGAFSIPEKQTDQPPMSNASSRSKIPHRAAVQLNNTCTKVMGPVLNGTFSCRGKRGDQTVLTEHTLLCTDARTKLWGCSIRDTEFPPSIALKVGKAWTFILSAVTQSMLPLSLQFMQTDLFIFLARTFVWNIVYTTGLLQNRAVTT